MLSPSRGGWRHISRIIGDLPDDATEERKAAALREALEMIAREEAQEAQEAQDNRTDGPTAKEVIAAADALVSKAHDAIYAEPFDRQKASDAVWDVHGVLRAWLTARSSASPTSSGSTEGEK